MAYEETRRVTRDSGAGRPEVLKKVVVLTPAQQTTLFSVPVILVQAPSVSRAIIPVAIHVAKEAGTAWTTTGSGFLRVKWNVAGNPTAFFLVDQATTTAFFGAAQKAWFSSVPATTLVLAAAGLPGAALALDLQTADISGGTGRLTVSIFYRIWGLERP